MSNYVRIGTSIPDILNIAGDLRLRGESLTSSVEGALEAVNALDVPSTFPRDHYTDQFLGQYTKPVEVGEDVSMPANEAVKHAARQVGPGLTGVGDFVTTVMFAYLQADERGAVEIEQAGGDPPNAR